MTDCAQFKLDTNPCSETFGTYRLFDIPCPPDFDDTADPNALPQFLVTVKNSFPNVLFKCEFVNNATNEKLIVSLHEGVNDIYLTQGAYRICFYDNKDADYAMNSFTQLTIFSGSCRNNVTINSNIDYTITSNE